MNQTVHNLLTEQLVSWETARNNYAALSGVQVKELKWIIDPEKRTRHYMPTLRTRKGNVLATEISTIFQDRQGALWFGTFNRGLLYYHPALYKHIHIDKKDFPLSLERNTAVANI